MDLFFSCELREPQPDKVCGKKENPFRVWNFERVSFGIIFLIISC